MKKKNRIVLLCIVCAIILAYTTAYLVLYYEDVQVQKEIDELLGESGIKSKEKHKKLVEEMSQEIDYINQNSNFGGIKLAESPLKNFKTLKSDTFSSWFDCVEYNGHYYIDKIEIIEGDFLGISNEDSYDIAVECMQERNYEPIGRNDDAIYWGGYATGYVYKKSYITIVFTVSDDNIIREIDISVDDSYHS